MVLLEKPTEREATLCEKQNLFVNNEMYNYMEWICYGCLPMSHVYIYTYI